jgi:Sigma-70 region 2
MTGPDRFAGVAGIFILPATLSPRKRGTGMTQWHGNDQGPGCIQWYEVTLGTRLSMILQTRAATESPSDDTELAHRIGQHDERAFEALMRRHNRMLYRLARSILRDDADAEDAVQEA